MQISVNAKIWPIKSHIQFRTLCSEQHCQKMWFNPIDHIFGGCKTSGLLLKRCQAIFGFFQDFVNNCHVILYCT